MEGAFMARFSVQDNMQSTTASPTAQVSQVDLTQGPLIFPSEYLKHTVAFDRDGVLCECRDVIDSVDDFVPIPNAMRAVAIIRSLGHRVAVLFDQPGISRKKLEIQHVEAMNQHMLNLLGAAGCTSIDGIFYSTSDKKRDIYAKPNLGLFRHAESMLQGVRIRGGMYVGDDIDDMVMAHKAGATPVLVLTGNGTKTLARLDLPIYKLVKPKVVVVETLMDLAQRLSRAL
jgi:D-glycero-D-manno-heptose 1,7-bisphosphate phosphatase